MVINKNVYIGKRYIPKIEGQHDINRAYESLSLVSYAGSSYISTKDVPIGVAITNTEYWFLESTFNAQLENYRQDVNNYKNLFDDYVDENNSYKTTNDINISAIEQRLLFLSDVYSSDILKGDGSDTTQEIQAFFNSITSNTRVYIKGDFVLNDILLLNNVSNIEIVLGEGTHFKATKHGYGVLEIRGCNFIKVRGHGKFEGYGSFPILDTSFLSEKDRSSGIFGIARNGDVTTTTPFGGGYEGNSGIGIFITESKNIIIEEQELYGFNFSGISVDCTRYPSYDVRIPISTKTSSLITYCENIILRNNVIHNIYNSGISLSTVDGFSFYDNKIYDIGHPNVTINDTHINHGYGITSTQSATHSKNGFIYCNKIKNCTRKGIDAHSGSNVKIYSNDIKNCFVNGGAITWVFSQYALEYFDIFDNTFTDCGQAPNITEEYPSGFMVSGMFTQLHNNTFRNCGRQSVIRSDSFSNVSPNVNNISIKDNVMYNNGTFESLEGITIKGASRIVAMSFCEPRSW